MPKIKYDEEKILLKVIEIAEASGFESITVRKIAEAVGCSVAPIYTVFGNVSEAINRAKTIAIEKVIDSTEVAYTDDVFLNIGVGLLVFAREHKSLYRELFMTQPEDKMIRHFHEISMAKLERSEMNHYFDYDELKVLHSKMWVFTQGLATMICSNQLEDVSTEFFIQAQHEVGGQLITSSLHRKGLLDKLSKECDDNETSTARWNIW